MTQKMDIMIDESYDLIWDRCHQQIVKGEMKHLLVLVGVPVAFPRLVRTTLNSRLAE